MFEQLFGSVGTVEQYRTVRWSRLVGQPEG